MRTKIKPKDELSMYKLAVGNNNTFSASLRLGNLFHSCLEGSDQATKALELLCSKATESEISNIVNLIHEMAPEDWRSLDLKTRDAIESLAKGVLLDDQWVVLLSKGDIIKLSNKFVDLARWGLYRLISKHNPDVEVEPPRTILNESSTKQSFLELSKILSQFNNLPIKDLLELSSSMEATQNIRLDLSSHPELIHLEACLVKKFPALSIKIANDWVGKISSGVLTQNEEIQHKDLARDLSRNFLEFKVVLMSSRVAREGQLEVPLVDNKYNTPHQVENAWILLNLPRLAATSKGLLAIMSGTATAGPILASTAITGGLVLAPFVLYAGYKLIVGDETKTEKIIEKKCI